MTYSLPWTEELLPGESLGSVTLRNAHAYGIANPIRLFRRLDLPKGVLGQVLLYDPESPNGRAVGRLLRLAPDAFAGMSYGTSLNNRLRVLGHLVRHDHTVVHRPRFCPICLATGTPYRRAIWDLAALTVCPVHSVRLVEKCQACGRLQDWGWNRVDLCSQRSCAADLRLIHAEEIPECDMKGPRALVAYVEGPPGGPFAFGNGELGDWLALVMALAAFDQGTRPDFGLGATFPLKDAHISLTRGVAILEGWPDTFHAMLGRWRDGAEGRALQHGLKMEFGDLGKWIQENLDSAFGAFLGKALDAYVSQHPDLKLRQDQRRRFASTDDLRTKQIPQREAMRLFGTSVTGIRAIAERHDLYVVRTNRGGTVSVLRGDRVHDLLVKSRKQVSKSSFYELLGIKAHHRGAEWERLIPVIPQDERVLPTASFELAAVRRFLARLENAAKPSTAKRLRPLPMATRAGRSLIDLCKAILDGDLVPRGIDEKAVDLRRILIDVRESDDAIEDDQPVYSVEAAAAKHGLADAVLYNMLKRGLIAALPPSAPRDPRRRLTRESLEQFFANYIFGEELAMELGQTAGGATAKYLRTFGIKPVSGPKVDGGTQYVYLRSTIADLDKDAFAKRVEVRKQSRNPRISHRANSKRTRAFVAAVAADVAAELNRGPMDSFNAFVSADCTEVVRVLTAQLVRIDGPFRVRLTAKLISDFMKAERGWLALALVGHPSYLLIPWDRIAHEFEKPAERLISIAVEADGRLDRKYAEFARQAPAVV